jgi:spermidine dehydrogenase
MEGRAGYYPPALTGMRGSDYASAHSTGHAMRDGEFWRTAPAATETADKYDLIVVGGGISGLAAAYFFQKQHGARWLRHNNRSAFCRCVGSASLNDFRNFATFSSGELGRIHQCPL